jgi:hypothetical protein
VEGALHNSPKPARQVDVGCRYDDRFLLFDADNAIERVLAFFGILLVARQTDPVYLVAGVLRLREQRWFQNPETLYRDSSTLSN